MLCSALSRVEVVVRTASTASPLFAGSSSRLALLKKVASWVRSILRVADLYKSAIRGKPNTVMGRLKQTQVWKILAILKSLLKAEAKLLCSFGHFTEGNSEVLRVESCLGQLLELARSHHLLQLNFLKNS